MVATFVPGTILQMEFSIGKINLCRQSPNHTDYPPTAASSEIDILVIVASTKYGLLSFSSMI